MNRFIVYGLMGSLAAGCGTDFLANSGKKGAATVTETQSKTTTICPNGSTNPADCITEEKDTTVVKSTPDIPITVIPVTSGTLGAAPDSYTFLDTPDANLCVDAFTRQGIVLPATTVARTMDVKSVRAGGIAIQDMGASTVPVLNVIHLDTTYSDIVFQFLNPVGFYCIVNNNARFSNVTIQRKCSAVIAEIEPMTHVTVNLPPPKKQKSSWCGWFSWFSPREEEPSYEDDSATTNSLQSSITQTPCIP